MNKAKIPILLVLIATVSAVAAGAAEIVVTGPAAGAVWTQGTEHAITWTATGSMDASVKIILRQGSAVIQRISDSTRTSAGTFTWRVTATLPNGSYTIKVKTLDNAVEGDSGAFTIGPQPLVSMAPAPTATVRAMPMTRTLTMAVSFHTKYRHRERHSANCLATMGIGPGPIADGEFKVGFFNRCEDRGPLCADECVSGIYRASPAYDASRLTPLVGKEIVKATLSFRHQRTESDPACAMGLAKAYFYAGLMGVADPPPSEVRPVSAVPPMAYVRLDVSDMMRSWLREKAPEYRGDRHNYHLELAGANERMDFNNQRCLTLFDSGILEIQYRE